jgi:hypothetical protein
MGYGLGRFFLTFIVVCGSLAFAKEKSLCEQMVDAAGLARSIAPFEIAFVQGKNSQSIMAFETEGDGKMISEIEYVLTGFDKQILRIKAFRSNRRINFNNDDLPRLLLARVLAANPQVHLIRETWIASELPEVIRALAKNKTPLEAVAGTFRAGLYRGFGFNRIVKFGVDFDERDSMILFDVDFATPDFKVPQHEPEVTARRVIQLAKGPKPGSPANP